MLDFSMIFEVGREKSNLRETQVTTHLISDNSFLPNQTPISPNVGNPLTHDDDIQCQIKSVVATIGFT